MSKSPSRRAVLKLVAGTAVATPTAASALGHPDSFPVTSSCDLELLELRLAIDAYQAAVRYEMRMENSPGHAAAVAVSEARQAVCEILAATIHERTPAGLRDVVLRAEVLRMYFFDGPSEMLEEFDCDPQGYALAKLYEAAMRVGGGHV